MPVQRRILFYIAPWIENARPGWKENYIWWFGKICAALEKASPGSTETYFLIGDDLELSWDKHINCPAHHVVITQSELKQIFPDAESAMVAWLRRSYTPEQERAKRQLVQEKLGAFIPDIIFATAPVPFLETAYPDALILHRDAMYCREPWPDEMTSLDPFGMYKDSALGKCMAPLLSVPNSPESDAFMAQIETLFLRPLQKNNPLHSLFKKYRERFSRLVLLPLQSSGHYNFYGYTEFKSQYEYLIHVLESTPRHIGVVVIQHPDDLSITSPGKLDYLDATYPHFLFDERLARYHAPSQFALPLVDGMVGVSSGLCYQALLWNKPLFVVGSSHFAVFGVPGGLAAMEATFMAPTQRPRTGLLHWLLTRYQFSYDYLYDGAWLTARLDRMLTYKKTSGQDFGIFTPFEPDQKIIARLKKSARWVRRYKNEPIWTRGQVRYVAAFYFKYCVCWIRKILQLMGLGYVRRFLVHVWGLLRGKR